MPDMDKRVLIIDDSKTNRAYIKMALQELGIANITEAQDGGQALLYLGGNQVDLVVLDWEMPNISGIQVLKALRDDIKTAELPVIMCTSNADGDHLVEAIEAGCSGYIVKPFQDGTFEKKLTELGFA